MLHSPCRVAAPALTMVGPTFVVGTSLQAGSIRGSGRLQKPHPRRPDCAPGLLWPVPPSSPSPRDMPSACCLPYSSGWFHFASPHPSVARPPRPCSSPKDHGLVPSPHPHPGLTLSPVFPLGRSPISAGWRLTAPYPPRRPSGPGCSGPRPGGLQTAEVTHGVHGAAGAGAGAALRIPEVPGAV